MADLLKHTFLFGDSGSLLTAGFNGPREDQTPFDGNEDCVQNTWTTLHTVTAGKIGYVTQVTFLNENANSVVFSLGHGSSADYKCYVLGKASITLTFNTPLKYTSGTAIQALQGSADTGNASICGWEE